jgi:hypothetical protein
MAKLLEEDLKMRKFIVEDAAAGGDLEGGDRASGQAVPRVDLCRPSGRHHRQEGRGHRKAAKKLAKMTERSEAEHRRDPQAGNRRKLVARALPISSSAASRSAAR